MNAVNTYELIYTGMDQPQHLLQATKAQMTVAALSQTDNARLAEFFLKAASFDSEVQAKTKAYGLQNHDVSSLRLLDYVKHIHHAKSDEIRERFSQPEISDDEASELLFDMELKQKLEKIKSKNTDIEIRL